MNDEQIKEHFQTWSEEMNVAGSELKDTVENLFKDASVHRLIIKSPEGKEIFEIPAIAGAAGALIIASFAAPALLIGGAVAYFMNYRIEVIRRETIETEDIVVHTEEAVTVEEVSTPEPVVKAAPKNDDLTKINGVGPKYQTVLNNAGIKSLEQLANIDKEELIDILQAAGMTRLNNAATWPQQAKELLA